MSDPSERRMRDIPMLDTDRQNMRLEFDNFDDMTLEEFRKASRERVDGLLDTYAELGRSQDAKRDRRAIKGAAYQAVKAAVLESEVPLTLDEVADLPIFNNYVFPREAAQRALRDLVEEGRAIHMKDDTWESTDA